MMKLSDDFKKSGRIGKVLKLQLGLCFFKCTLYLYSYMISTAICVNRLKQQEARLSISPTASTKIPAIKSTPAKNKITTDPQRDK